MRRRSKAVEADDEEFETEQRRPRMGGTDIFRGLLVVVLAIAVGGFVFTRALDDTENGTSTAAGSDGGAADGEAADVDPAPSAAEGDPAGAEGDQPLTGQSVSTTTPTAASSSASTTATTLAATTTEVLLRSPAEVKVLVLNGADTQGIAAKGTEALKAFGYVTGAAKNASSQRPSAILHTPGFDGEAVAVAEVFGPGLDTLVQPFDPADSPIGDTQDADIIVVIGNDNLIPVS